MFSSMVRTRLRPGSGSRSLEPSTLRRASMAVYITPGAPCRLAVEFFFEAAEAVVVDAHVAQHLRGDLVVGIEALELFLEVDALHVEGFDGGGDLRRDAARDPGEVVAGSRGARRSALRWSALSSGSVWTIAARVRAAACLSAISLRDRRRWSRPARSWPARAGCGRRGRRGAEPLQRCAAAAFRRARRSPGGARSGARRGGRRWRRPRRRRRGR